MRYVIDIDNHILFSKITYCDQCGRCNYELTGWDEKEIAAINRHYEQDDIITLWTGRGWDLLELTIEQLKQAGVKYHSLVMGKPLGIYIDKESKRRIDDRK